MAPKVASHFGQTRTKKNHPKIEKKSFFFQGKTPKFSFFWREKLAASSARTWLGAGCGQGRPGMVWGGAAESLLGKNDVYLVPRSRAIFLSRKRDVSSSAASTPRSALSCFFGLGRLGGGVPPGRRGRQPPSEGAHTHANARAKASRREQGEGAAGREASDPPKPPAGRGASDPLKPHTDERARRAQTGPAPWPPPGGQKFAKRKAQAPCSPLSSRPAALA